MVNSMILNDMPAGLIPSIVVSVVPMTNHQICPILLAAKRKETVNHMKMVLVHHLEPLPNDCLRTTCTDQLSKLHDLLQSGAISQVQYDEMKDIIMKDMKSVT